MTNQRISRISFVWVVAILMAVPGVFFAATGAAAQGRGLSIALDVPGLEDFNLLERGTAVPAVVEVRDRNDLPVSGASVLFFLGSDQTATLDEGLLQVTLTTDELGRAEVMVNPIADGPLELTATASFEDEEVSQTFQGNVATAAQAPTAGSLAVMAGGVAGAAGGVAAAVDGMRPRPPTVILELTPDEISEGGETQVSLRLTRTTSEAVTVTVSATPVSSAFATRIEPSGTTLTVEPGEMRSRGVTFAAVDDPIDAPDTTVRVTGEVTAGRVASGPLARTLTIVDNDVTPVVTLELSEPSITEEQGTSMLSATLTGPSSEMVTLTVSMTPVAPALASDFEASGTTLTIDPGERSSDRVTITANDNLIYAPPAKTVEVTASVADGRVRPPDPVTLTITEDDPRPTVTLVLTRESISEDDEVGSEVRAHLSGATSEEVNVTVGLSDSSGFVLSGNPLSIPAGRLESTGAVTIAAVPDEVYGRDRTVTLTASVSGGHGVTYRQEGPPLTLTITEAKPPPTVTLVLSRGSISEDDERGSHVTAHLRGVPASEELNVTVTASPVGLADSRAFRLSGNQLRIPAGRLESTGAATIVGVDDGVFAPDRTVVVAASVAGLQGVTYRQEEPPLTLTITEDEPLPEVTLVLTPASISEDGGESRVTARLSGRMSEEVNLAVTASAVAPADASVFRLRGSRLRIPARGLASTGTVTIAAVSDEVYGPAREVEVTATVSGDSDVKDASATLTITEDERLPTVTLVLTPSSISEDGGESRVTAHLDGRMSEEVNLVVTASAVAPADAQDFELSDDPELTIAAGRLASTGTVTIAAVDDEVYGPAREVEVTATVSAGGVTAPAAETLTITDDDEEPVVTLVLTPASISEDGGESRVTARLSTAVSEEVRLAVTASAVAPADAQDFELSDDPELTIAAGRLASTGTVTIAAVDDEVYGPAREVEVTAAVSAGSGVRDPVAQTLTIIDDEEAPTVTLVLTPETILEGGASLVTAHLSGAMSEEVKLRVTASAVAPADAQDFALSDNLELTIPAGQLDSTGTVRVETEVDDDAEPDREVTVAATVTSPAGLDAPSVRTLTITDEPGTVERQHAVVLSVEPSSIFEGAPSVSVTVTGRLSTSRDVATVVALSVAGTAIRDVDYNLNPVGAFSLTIPAGETEGTAFAFILANADNPNHTDVLPETVVVVGTAAGLSVQSATIIIRGPFDAFAPDVVGSASATGPTVRETLSPLTLAAGGYVATVGLEEAFAGESLTYALASSDREVAAVRLAGETATVTSVGEGMATVTVRATNDFGTAVQTFAVTVVTDPREAVAVEAALAAVGRGMLTGITSTVERRFRGAGETRTVVVAGRQMPLGQAPLGGAATPPSMLAATTARGVDEAAADAAMREAAGLGMVAPSAHRMLPARDVTFENLLQGSAFALSLGGGQDQVGGEPPAAGARWTVWGGGDVQSFRGAPGGDAYDGDVRTGHVGVDFQRAGWLAGVALSRSAAAAGYEFDGEVTGAGGLKTKLTNVQPYLRWAPRRGTEVWTILGAGGGEVSNLRSHVGYRLETSDLSMRLGVAGVRQALPAAGGVDVAVRGDVGLLRLATGAGSEMIDDMSVDAQRLRVGLEASRSVSLGAATLTSFTEVGGRHDGGDGQTGTGLELAGGLRLTGFGSRLGLEARGHVLAVHTASGYAERGGSVTATWTPSGDSGGRGLAVTLLPRWGAPGGAGTLWLDDALQRYGAGGSAAGPGALDTRVAYGFGVGRNVLAPFSEFGRSAAGYQRLRFGAHLAGDRGLRFEVGGERLDRAVAGATADHRLLLVGGMSF